MKIPRRGFIAGSTAALVLAKHQLSTAAKARASAAAPVWVYTTAVNTDYRLTPTGTLEFKPMGQPLETQICVFVDPAKTFQTILGVGGALTDAAAETFAKLPKAKQQELLTAYFDRDRGIGYNLARTNIHSCDFSSSGRTACLNTWSLLLLAIKN